MKKKKVLSKKLTNFFVLTLLLSGAGTVILFFASILVGGILWYIDLALFIVTIISFLVLGTTDTEFEVEKRKKAEEQGKIYCLNSDIAKIIKSFGTPYCSVGNCPICNGIVEKDNNYYFKKRIKEKEDIKGVYVTHTYTQGEAKQAWQWVYKEKEFSAEKRFCPQCEWEIYYGEYSGYDEVTSFVRDDEGGGYETREEYCTNSVRAFNPGKILPEVFESFKNDRRFKSSIKHPENYIYKVESPYGFYKKD